MKLVVTGAAGFIGSHFAEYSRIDNSSLIAELILIDKLTYAGNIKNLRKVLDLENVRFFQRDITDFQAMLQLTQGADFVVNFAAETHVDRSIANSQEFIRTNIVGTHTLLETCKLNNVGTYLQVSTDEVYGSIQEEFADENYALLPNSPYSASKASADLLCRSYFKTYGLDIRITRCGNNYGKRQYPEKLIPLFISKILKGEKLPLYGNGQNIRNWIHVEDHVEAIWRVLTKGKPGEIYNIAGEENLSNIEIVTILCEKMSYSLDNIEHTADRLGHDFRYALNATKIRDVMGFVANKSLAESLDSIIHSYT